MSLESKIDLGVKCDGIGVRPKKSEVYRLAAELLEIEEIRNPEGISFFGPTIVNALRAYAGEDRSIDGVNDYMYMGADDYMYMGYDYYSYTYDRSYFDYGYAGPEENYGYKENYGYDRPYGYADFTEQEKIIALLFLAAMHESKGD